MERNGLNIDFRALNLLEAKLKSLKMEWDFFFTGQRRTPPLKELENYDKEMKKCKNSSITDNALRFKFNSIFSNYTSYKELWAKKLKQIEEGKIRVAKEKMLIDKNKPKSIIVSKQSNINEQIENIFLAYSSLSENKRAISFIEFEKKLRQQLLELFRKTNCSMLKVSVALEEGKTKIKIKPVKEKTL